MSCIIILELSPIKETLVLKLFFFAQFDRETILAQLRLQRDLHIQQLNYYRQVTSQNIHETASEFPTLMRDVLLWETTPRFGQEYEELYVRWLEECIQMVRTQFLRSKAMIDRILVIGGTGMLGRPVAQQLLATGFKVRVLTRNPQKARTIFPAPFEVVSGNVEDAASLVAAMQDCQGVHINLHGLFDPDLERRGAESVARAAAQVGLERISYLSGGSVCPENAWFPDTKARLLAEESIQKSGVPFPIFRANYFTDTLRNFVRGKMLLQIGRHPHPYQWVVPADYARMVARAYTTVQAANKIFYVCGPQALTMRQALRAIQRIAYPDYRIIYLPLWAAGLVARIGKRRELQSVLPFFAYCEKIQIFLSGTPDEANELLGAPSITLEEWVRQELVSKM